MGYFLHLSADSAARPYDMGGTTKYGFRCYDPIAEEGGLNLYEILRWEFARGFTPNRGFCG